MPNEKPPFQFQQIEGFISLEEATFELVRLAKHVQRSHSMASAKEAASFNRCIWESRKAGVKALMDLIDQYVYQQELL